MFSNFRWRQKFCMNWMCMFSFESLCLSHGILTWRLSQSSKSFGSHGAYMEVLNSKGNMRLVNHEVNGWVSRMLGTQDLLLTGHSRKEPVWRVILATMGGYAPMRGLRSDHTCWVPAFSSRCGQRRSNWTKFSSHMWIWCALVCNMQLFPWRCWSDW